MGSLLLLLAHCIAWVDILEDLTRIWDCRRVDACLWKNMTEHVVYHATLAQPNSLGPLFRGIERDKLKGTN